MLTIIKSSLYNFSNTITINFNQSNLDHALKTIWISALTVLSILGSIIILLMLFSLWKIYTKASKPGWAALIPFYNIWVLFGILGWNPNLSLLYLLSFLIIFSGHLLIYAYLALIIFSVFIALNLAKVFKKSVLFAIFGLLLFPYVGYPMLAFGKSKYSKK